MIVARWALLVVALWLLGIAVPAHGQADDGLGLQVDALYEMRPDRRDVAVTLGVKAANTLTDTEDDFGVTRFFFDELVFSIPVEARDVTATDATGELQVDLTERAADGLSEVTISLRSRLYSGQATDMTVDFVLPATAPRSEGDIRVDRAGGWFFLWAYGDPGSSTVTASIPDGFAVRVIGDSLRRTSNDAGDRIHVSGPIDDPLAWVAVISASNDEALDSRTIDIAGTQVELRSWPSDPEWSAGVEEILRSGIPALTELIERPWTTDVVVAESIEPSIHGFGGWYVGSSDSIELGEDLDPHLILHEVSHAWFDDDLFTDRWITEGLAEVYADAAVVETGGEALDTERVTRSAVGNLPLNDWADPNPDERPQDATEAYGYAASRNVVHMVVEEIGFEAMADVLEAAWTDTIAYRGDTALDFVAARDDWRRFLDLVEEVGGSSQARSLFDTWVVDDEDAALLEDRYPARSEYHTLESLAAEWALPPGLRRAMSDWDFAGARAEIRDVEEVIAARDRMRLVADEADVEPVSLESRFEAGEEPGVLIGELEAQEAVASHIITAASAVSAERSLFENAGLLGAGLPGELDAARRAFGSGDLAVAEEVAASVVQTVARAEDVGRLRVVVLGASSAALIVVIVAFRRRSRIRTARRSST